MRMNQLRAVCAAILAVLVLIPNTKAQERGFPFILPAEQPERKLSAAVERSYDKFDTPRPEDNELFSLFKYTELEGFDYHNFDGTVTRRDPSKVLFRNGKYYVWYTHRHTDGPVKGPLAATDTIAARDWTCQRSGTLLLKTVSPGKNKAWPYRVPKSPIPAGDRSRPPTCLRGKESTTCTTRHSAFIQRRKGITALSQFRWPIHRTALDTIESGCHS